MRFSLTSGGTKRAGQVKTLRQFPPAHVEVSYKSRDNPVTAADRTVNEKLKKMLLRPGEGWLSEESVDDLLRLQCRRVWVVDPLDGTREFVAGVPEWAVSIGFVEDGQAVAGGISNPRTRQVFLGSLEAGVMYNGQPAKVAGRQTLRGAVVLASRSEVHRGEWEPFQDSCFTVQPMGSVAYKLALVASGLADATWTLVPKHEWDIAAGVALAVAAGGMAYTLDGNVPSFNRRNPRISGLIAHPPCLQAAIRRRLALPG